MVLLTGVGGEGEGGKGGRKGKRERETDSERDMMSLFKHGAERQTEGT